MSDLMSGNQPIARLSGPPSQPSLALSPRRVAEIAVAAFVATIFCAGGLIGVAYLCLPHAQDALERANLMPRGLALPFNRSAWMTQRVLGDVYKSSLDVVVADEQVIERLGEPIETDLAAPELYRRAARGTKLVREETIEYELIGPKARATVSVTASTSPMQIDEIKATLEDGTVLELKSAVPEHADVQ